MNCLRAIILLVIYTAFVTTSAFTRHECGEWCVPSSSTHTDFDEAGVPAPFGCTEEEVLNKTVTEHRAVGSIKLAVRSGSHADVTDSGARFISRITCSYSGSGKVLSSTVPLYLRHRHLRL